MHQTTLGSLPAENGRTQIAAIPKKRIVMRLMHGVGNQLFQYALGRRLSIDRGAKLFLDAAWYNRATSRWADRPLALREFNIAGEITFDDRWKSKWLPPTFQDKVRWWIEQRFFPLAWRGFVEEAGRNVKLRGQAFDPKILRVARNAYFHGFWTSPRYFEGIEETLREELVLKDVATGRMAEYLAIIRNSEAVSVHVRRGDFLKYSEFGILRLDYYRRAFQIIRSKIREPRFFVFSDDIREAQKLLHEMPDCEYVALGPGTTPACDLWLMAACKHFVNANSTFSWWGAWLSVQPNKIVIVPDKWLVGANREVRDIYLPEWIKIPVR